MRSDMFKVIVERPRRSKHNHAQAARRRDDPDGPRQLGMRAGYGRPSLNENLMPLQRFLRAQIGRPWNKVYSEISAGIDRRNTVQQHIFAHLDDMIATQVERRDGRWVDLKGKNPYFQRMGVLRQPLYVDPRTGLIRANKQYRSWAADRRAQQAADVAMSAARRRDIDEATSLMLLDGEWYEVRFAPLPPIYFVEEVVAGVASRRQVADCVHDVLRKCDVRRRADEGTGEQPGVVVMEDVYAVVKRQLSRREMAAHGLRKPA